MSSWIVASLDRHKTYLNFSTFQGEHVQYICGEKSSSRESLLTEPLGPWDIRDVKDIQHLVRIPVALALKANLVVLSPHDCGLCQVVPSTNTPRAIHVQLYMEARPQWGSEIFLGAQSSERHDTSWLMENRSLLRAGAEAICKGDQELEEANTDLRETFGRTLMGPFVLTTVP